MRLFESTNGQTYGYFIDGTQDDLIEEAIKAGWRELSQDEIAARAAPQAPVVDKQKAESIAIIKAQLVAIDKQKVRAITDAMLTGDKTRLQDLEAQAQGLRTQLAALN